MRFQITHCDVRLGKVIVEDMEKGFRREFTQAKLAVAEIVDFYNLLITTTDGEKYLIPILS